MPLKLQSAIRKLSDEIDSGRAPHGFIEKYVPSVIIRTHEKPPHTPSLYSLDYGALIQLCMDMQEQPPASDTRAEMVAARGRLTAHPKPYLLSQKLCHMTEADLKWLASQEKVLGPGSVVKLRCDDEGLRRYVEPSVIIRPTTRHSYKEATQTVERKLFYVIERTSIIAATDIMEEVVVLAWPMTGSTLSFACKDNPDPYNLSKTEMRLRAAEMGYVGESDDNLVHNFVNRTAADKYVAQYQIEVKEEWDRGVRRLDAEFAASVAAQDARPDEEPAKDEEPPKKKSKTTSSNTCAAASTSTAPMVLNKYDTTPAKKLTKKAKKAAAEKAKKAADEKAAQEKWDNRPRIKSEVQDPDFQVCLEQMGAGVHHEVALKEYQEAMAKRTAPQASSASSSSASSSSAVQTAQVPKKDAAKAGRTMPDKSTGEIMAELNRCAAQGLQVTVSSLPPATVSSLHPPIVRKTVTLEPLTAAEEKEYDDTQAAAKAARAEKRAEKKRRR